MSNSLFAKAECVNCGAPLTVIPGELTVKCPYCHTQLVQIRQHRGWVFGQTDEILHLADLIISGNRETQNLVRETGRTLESRLEGIGARQDRLLWNQELNLLRDERSEVQSRLDAIADRPITDATTAEANRLRRQLSALDGKITDLKVKLGLIPLPAPAAPSTPSESNLAATFVITFMAVLVLLVVVVQPMLGYARELSVITGVIAFGIAFVVTVIGIVQHYS